MRIAIAFFLLLASVFPCFSAPELPIVEPGEMYKGMLMKNGVGFKVTLTLLHENFFVLRRTWTPEGERAVSRDITGRWRQTGEGTFLRLSNAYGFAQRLNVGARGTLYGDFAPSSAFPPLAVALKKIPFAPEPFQMMGVLTRRQGSGLVLRDCAAQKEFPVSPESGPHDFSPAAPLFVEAAVTITARGARIEKLLAVTENPPKSANTAVEIRAFGDIVDNTFWLLPEQRGIGKISCSFNREDARTGRMEISGPGLRLVAAYEDKGRGRIAIAVTGKDARMLRALGAESLLDMLTGATGWSLEDNELLLHERHGKTFSLIKASARGLER